MSNTSRFARREKAQADKKKKPTNRSRSGSKSPGRGGDRLMPNFNKGPLSTAEFLNRDTSPTDEINDSYQQSLRNAINPSDAGGKILSYNNRPKSAFGGSHASKVIFSASKSKSKIRAHRNIPEEPERILDAPQIKDDFYLNLMKWGPGNVLAVALTDIIFLWNAETTSIKELAHLEENSEEYVSSIEWIDHGNLAFGDSRNRVQIWDVESGKALRKIRGHASRVSSLAVGKGDQPWLISSGSLSGQVKNFDVRQPNPLVSTFDSHELEVSGLEWSPDGKFLASGGNDNIVNIWTNDVGASGATPLRQLTDHQAGVKALSWCPWKPQVLASGGGSACRKMMIWNCANGTKLLEIDTENQISGIHWNQHHKEVITAHGYPNYKLRLWKYPKFSFIADLEGHEGRILSSTISPCGECVASVAADETLRIWKCFEVKKKTKVAGGSVHNPSKIINTLR